MVVLVSVGWVRGRVMIGENGGFGALFDEICGYCFGE